MRLQARVARAPSLRKARTVDSSAHAGNPDGDMMPMPLTRLRTLALIAVSAPLLAACASSSTGTSGSSRPQSGTRQPLRAPAKPPARDAVMHMIPGLENVIGANQANLVKQFGKPRLEVWEGDARKLQFTGTACLLDIYLYPTSHSREPLATYADARRPSDGKDVDRAACVAALRQK
jgi:hypothetical protein